METEDQINIEQSEDFDGDFEEALNIEPEITKEYLEDILKKVNIKLICATHNGIPENIPIISLNNIYDYVHLASDLNVKNVFASSEFHDKEEFLIKDEFVLLKYGEQIFNLIKPSLEKYNKKVEKIDFSTAYDMNIFFIKENVTYVYLTITDWTCYGIDNPEIIVDNMVKNSSKKIEEITKHKEEEAEKLRLELQEKILNDPKFDACTNMRLRDAYTRNLIDSPDFEKYKVCFMNKRLNHYNPLGRYNPSEVFDWVEMLWRLVVKERKRIESIPIKPPFLND